MDRYDRETLLSTPEVQYSGKVSIRMCQGHNLAIPTVLLAILLVPFRPGWGQEHSPETCEIAVEHLADLGALSDSGSVQIPMEVDLAAAPWGGWLVTEDGAPILRYGDSGTFEGFFARLGEGPNELEGPMAVAVDAADSVWVSDPRGRVVVFGPTGAPVRTIVDEGIFQVHGFTPSGSPFGVLSRYAMTGRDPQGWEVARVWSRDGALLHELGPGAFQADGRGALARQASPPQSVAVGDTVLLVPRGSEGWIRRWTPVAQDTLSSIDAIWRALGLDQRLGRSMDGHPVAIGWHRSEGFWLLGAIRRLSSAEEEALVTETPRVARERLPVFRRRSAPVRNAVYDGVILHMDDEGGVLHGELFDEYPWGFDGAGHFYTFAEEDTGLVKIRVWSVRESCG